MQHDQGEEECVIFASSTAFNDSHMYMYDYLGSMATLTEVHFLRVPTFIPFITALFFF